MTGPSPDLIRGLTAELWNRIDSTKLHRVRVFLDSIESGVARSDDLRQNPRVGFFPGLRARPFHDPAEFPPTRRVTDLLESGFDAIKSEYRQAVDAHGDIFGRCKASSRHRGLLDNDWGSFTIWERGHCLPAGRRFFPETSARVERLCGALSPLDEVAFLRLKPGVRIPPHTDATNLTLTCHLGVQIPAGCGLRVADETRHWEEGRCLWFDHSFEHEAWNLGTEPRVILLLDVLHPDVSAAERSFFEELSRLMIERLSAGRRAAHA
jgi:Aspartyl/Asparaginyl beta-hydroxylase